MGTEENKALVRRFVEEIFVRGRSEAVDELVDEAFAAHTWPSTGDPRGDLKRAMERVATGLADARFEIDDMIAEGDRVAVRLTASATQVGPFMGLPPSGRRYTIDEIHIFRVGDGRVVEHWHQFDQLGLMRQLGAMPGGHDQGAGRGEGAGQEQGAGHEQGAGQEQAAGQEQGAG